MPCLIVALLLIAPLATLIVLGILAVVGVITSLLMRGGLVLLGHQSHWPVLYIDPRMS